VAPRFYEPDVGSRDVIYLSENEARHAIKSLRLGLESEVEVFDGKGGAWLGVIESISSREVRVRLLSRLTEPTRELPFELVLATAVPKGERFDWLVEKAVELGASKLIPLKSTRSVADPGSTKLERLQRAVVEASKQCKRVVLMKIGPTIPFRGLIESEPKASLRLIAHPGGLEPEFWPRVQAAGRVIAVVGPEGGFDDDELAYALSHGWTVIDLGPTILRIETAGLAVCALLAGRR
jgi:16S rRNA (uracil1498-N3)-methyltransferase